MKRATVAPRENSDEKVQRSGVYNIEKILSQDKTHRHWDESTAYLLSQKDVRELLNKINPIISMSRDAIDFLLDGEWGTLGIPRSIFEFARNSFDDQELDLYTRYDFAYLGNNDVKLVGIEADSPKYFIETAHTQRIWLLEKFGQQAQNNKVTQLNSIPEMSTEAFKRLRDISQFGKINIASGGDDRSEDWITANYINKLAVNAGWKAENIRIKDLHWSRNLNAWADGKENYVTGLYKNYPWDILLNQQIARDLIAKSGRLELLLEPAWKMILSNRAILPALWELFPSSDILSPAVMSEYSKIKGDKVISPLSIHNSRNEVGILKDRNFTSWGEKLKDFSQQTNLIERKLEIPKRHIDKNGGYRFTYISVFTVAGNLAGLGIRETRLPLLGIYSTFKPHVVQL